MRPLLAILFGTVLGAQTPQTGPDIQTRRATLEGALEDSIRNRTTPVGDLQLESYTARITARFRGGSRVTVIRESDMAPLALANGALFVPLSLFQAAENEAEFAASLAYAIARTALPPMDPHRPVFLFGGTCGPANRIEAEPVRAALRLLADAGYDPDALGAFMRRMRCTFPPGIEQPAPAEYVTDTSAFAEARAEAAARTAKPRRVAPSLIGRGRTAK